MLLKKHPRYSVIISDCGTVVRYYHSNKDVSLRHDKDGYLIFSYWDRVDKRQRNLRVHRLVAETFIPNPENHPVINHKDGNKENNSSHNLEWCTISHNTKHAYDTGLAKPLTCQDSPHTSLTNEDVHNICRDIELGMRNVDIRKKHGISKAVLDHIRYGNTWSDIKSQYDMTISRKGRLGKLTVFWVLDKLNEGLTAKEIVEQVKSEGVTVDTVYNISSGRVYSYWVEEYKNQSPETRGNS